LKQGDTLGILCISTKESFKVVFELNGVSLGAAFDVQGKHWDWKSFHLFAFWILALSALSTAPTVLNL